MTTRKSVSEIQINDEFHHLTVISGPLREIRAGQNRVVFICKCKCGITKTIQGSSLLYGHTKSCGCWQRNAVAITGKLQSNLKHGHTCNGKTTPEFRAWENAKNRCYNPKRKDYKNYGARGIKMADEWLGKNGFVNFIAHIGLKPLPELSLDRIDNNGNYELGNVRWATKSQQRLNQVR